MKFVHALNVVVAYIGMEKFGNAQTVTTQRKTKKEKRLLITGLVPVVRSLCTFIDLCIHIDANTGFQFDGDVVIPDETKTDCFTGSAQSDVLQNRFPAGNGSVPSPACVRSIK